MNPTNDPVYGSGLERPKDSILGIGYSLLITSEDTDGQYELMKFVVPKGLGPPLHLHNNEDECFYVTDGQFEVTLGDETFQADTGTFLHLPRKIPHAVHNARFDTASFLCWVMPGNLGSFFDAFKKPWPLDEVYPPMLSEEDIQKLLETSKDYGIELMA